MKIVILAFDGCAAISSLGSYDLFKKANQFARGNSPLSGSEPLFEVSLVGVNRKSVPELGGVGV